MPGNNVVNDVVHDAYTQSTSYILLGFTLAAAIAWNKVVSGAISQFVKMPKDMVAYEALYAVVLTLLGVVVHQLFASVGPVKKPMPIIGVVGGR